MAMKKRFFFSLLVTLGFFSGSLIFSGCGPSAEERRQAEIEDSLQLEKDRRELLERAGRMFDTTPEQEATADGDTL